MKLPKDVVGDPRHEKVLGLLTQDALPLWPNGHNRVATVAPTEALLLELSRDLATSLAVQGLEAIGRVLGREQHGLDALRKKSPEKAQAPRISRLLLIANDGSERFYRECDSLLSKYSERLICCRLDVTGAAFGEALLGPSKLVRAVLVADKTACSRALLALL